MAQPQICRHFCDRFCGGVLSVRPRTPQSVCGAPCGVSWLATSEDSGGDMPEGGAGGR
jgi:hypothetical protein